jgi:hypothetical protein
MRKAERKIILTRLTTKFGCVKREFASFSDAMADTEDRTGLIEKDTFAWSINGVDEKTCLAWGVIPAKEVLEHYGHVNFVGDGIEKPENRRS